MQHAGGTFEQIGSTAKRIGILKDDNTLYKPLKVRPFSQPLTQPPLLVWSDAGSSLFGALDLSGPSCGGFPGRIREAASAV
jgi:hypothetical protein